MRCVAYRVRLLVLSLVSIILMALPSGARDLPAQAPKAEQAGKEQPRAKPQAKLRRAKRGTATAVAPAQAGAAADPLDENEIRQKLNGATVGLAAGQLEGAPLRFATELARVLDDGQNMRVVPMVTRGIFDNMYDLLFLRGVDAAIVYGDTLDHFRNNTKIGAGLEQRISYIMPLFPSEVHIFVRPEITKLEDLAGKRVNFNTKGTAAAYSGPIIFDRLGIDVDPQFDPHPVAMAEMLKSDRYAAVVFVSSKPLDPFVKQKWPEGYKFLPVPLTPKIEEFYIPAQLEAADYPGLIPNGQKVQTIAVPSVLAVINFPREHERYKRMARLVDYLFERFPKLQTDPGYHPKWKELNLAGTVPGWTRFPAMQAKLNASSPPKAVSDSRAELRGHLERMLPGDPGSQQKLLRDLLDERRSTSKR